MRSKFYAFYEGDTFGEVAVFNTEKERDTWVADETNFIRTPLSFDEAVDILACDPAKAIQREDIIYDGVIWLSAPPIEYEEDFL